MDLERAWTVLIVAAITLIVAFVFVQAGVIPDPWAPEMATVTVLDEDGTPKALVEAEVASTFEERRTGLSEHDSLADGEGMVFVHSREGEYTYAMPAMDFDIDIVFIDADRTITSIHHARAPGPDEDGSEFRYTGVGKWVLEVPRGYANETGMAVGDEVVIDFE